VFPVCILFLGTLHYPEEPGGGGGDITGSDITEL
jgi:hypothetical protein